MQEYSRAKNWLQRAADKGIEEAQTFIEEKII
jgi:TPR repeat protein